MQNQSIDDTARTLQSPGRRTVLSNAAMLGLGLGVVGIAGSLPSLARAAATPQQPEADSGADYKMPKPNAKTEAEFRMGVIGPATLSLITSQMAVDRASDAKTKEFANFELREAIAVTTVLKSLKTPQPPMDPIAKETLAKIKAASDGSDFDKTYMMAQLENHEYLRDLAVSYLSNSEAATSMPEMHGRHLATLALATFKEHVVISKDILQTLGA